MPLSWNEIRHRVIQFAHNRAGTRSQAAEKQTFWNECFDAFGHYEQLTAPLLPAASRMRPRKRV
jgi:hypothetical protein